MTSEKNFKEWHPAGLSNCPSLDIGAVSYGVDGRLIVDLRHCMDEASEWRLIFDAPLAIRIADQGSLMEYWKAGLVVRNHSLFVAHTSAFLDWLERSSAGAYVVGEASHYALFSDDTCIEVLAIKAPTLERILR